jgi:hypothetical protein
MRLKYCVVSCVITLVLILTGCNGEPSTTSSPTTPVGTITTTPPATTSPPNEASTKKTLNITGVVTDYQSNAPAKSIEVKLYTFHQNPVLEYLPPTGHILDTDITNEEGKFQLLVNADLFRKLEQLSYKKLVVFVAPGISGFKVIDLSNGTIGVDLVTGAPAPAGMK